MTPSIVDKGHKRHQKKSSLDLAYTVDNRTKSALY